MATFRSYFGPDLLLPVRLAPAFVISYAGLLCLCHLLALYLRPRGDVLGVSASYRHGGAAARPLGAVHYRRLVDARLHAQPAPRGL